MKSIKSLGDLIYTSVVFFKALLFALLFCLLGNKPVRESFTFIADPHPA